MSQEDVHGTCEECGSSIYQAHIDTGIARYEEGKLLCAHCVAEFEAAHDVSGSDLEMDDLAPIELEGFDEAEETPAAMSSTRIHSSSAATLGQHGAWDDSAFERSLDPKGAGGSRCRTFHCRLSDGAIDFMNSQINDWLNGNDKITVKFATSTIGLFEGKHTEPNMIMTVFY